MTREYSKKGSALKPFELTDEMLTAMGRIMRTFAEIEDIIDLYMCRLADIPEGLSMLMMARVSVGQRLNLVHTLATALGGQAKENVEACFNNDQFKTLHLCRNAIAHGVVLGLTDQGKVAFRTKVPRNPAGIEVGAEVVSFLPSDFAKIAETARIALPRIERRLGVRGSREARHKQPLQPHSKAQPTRPPSAERPHPRKPSPEKPQSPNGE